MTGRQPRQPCKPVRVVVDGTLETEAVNGSEDPQQARNAGPGLAKQEYAFDLPRCEQSGIRSELVVVDLIDSVSREPQPPSPIMQNTKPQHRQILGRIVIGVSLT